MSNNSEFPSLNRTEQHAVFTDSKKRLTHIWAKAGVKASLLFGGSYLLGKTVGGVVQGQGESSVSDVVALVGAGVALAAGGYRIQKSASTASSEVIASHASQLAVPEDEAIKRKKYHMAKDRDIVIVDSTRYDPRTEDRQGQQLSWFVTIPPVVYSTSFMSNIETPASDIRNSLPIAAGFIGFLMLARSVTRPVGAYAEQLENASAAADIQAHRDPTQL